MTQSKRRITYSNVTATLALVVALGGTSYAAVQLPKNSVGAKQIKTNAVGSADVKNGSLQLADVKPSEVSKLKGTPGTPGTPGTARAYGVFRGDGTLVEPKSKDVAVTKLPGTTGQYCVDPTPASGIDPTKTTIVATPDFSDGTGFNHLVQIVGAASGSTTCPSGYYLYTRNFDDGTDNYSDTDMAISFVIP